MADLSTVLLIGGGLIAGNWLIKHAGVRSEPKRTEPQHRRKGPRAPAKQEVSVVDRVLDLSSRGARRSDQEDAELSRLLRRNPLFFPSLDRAQDHWSEAQRQSATFHGTPGETVKVGGREKVVLGKAEEIVYRPPRGSRRGDADWVHAFGDTGEGRPKLKGRPLVVADAKTGKVELVGGPAGFDPARGIVG